ncbi:hypothetical protein Clim_1922 [Chlorobium limicola DSM 245]|uniref:Uncharacterized protein n=1 Tax=Chlorobium limicola (strain DSM 245 / NBRC 103803 / 6330) TaxID=290315 RepID=B3EFJ2_CHLL2|nr:hypothetical protein Clim_1922 [Chlorobium limicola DSM 245]
MGRRKETGRGIGYWEEGKWRVGGEAMKKVGASADNLRWLFGSLEWGLLG